MSVISRAALVIALAATVAAAGPIKRAITRASRPPTCGTPQSEAAVARFLIGVDASASSEPMRRAHFGLIDLIVDRIAPRHSVVKVYPFARTYTVAYSGTVRSARQLWAPLDPYLNESALGLGTHPRGVLAAMAEDVEADEGPIYIVMCWDGENSEQASLAPVAERLAGMPQLQGVWVVGPLADLEHGFRVQVEEQLRPLGGRCIVSSMSDRAAGLEQFGRLVQTSCQTSERG